MMGKKLKVYSACLDGRTRVITAAHSKREAYEQVRVCDKWLSFYYFNQMVEETGCDTEVELAFSKERSVWQSPVNSDDFRRIDA